MPYTWGSNGTTTKIRVPGGGNTFFRAGIFANGSTVPDVGGINALSNVNSYLEFMSDYTDNPGQASANAQPIHPIGSPYPVEIAAAYSQGMGSLQLRFWQLWGEDGWVSALQSTGLYDSENLSNLESSYNASPYGAAHAQLVNREKTPVDLYQVLRAQRKAGGTIALQKFELGGNGEVARIKTYHGAIITNIQQPEQGITVSSMTVMCTVTINYCYSSLYYVDGTGTSTFANY